jgi:hypothetical protein
MVGIGESFEALSVVGFDPRRTSTLRRCLATGLALHRYGLWSLRLPKPFATPLKKTEFDFLSHLFFSGLPALATATLGPTGIVPFGRAGEESLPRSGCIGNVTDALTLNASMMSPCASGRGCLIPAALAPPPLGGTRCARSDTPRTPLVFPVGESIIALNMAGFDGRRSMFAASCSRRIRLASLPSRPSFARRPCLAISVQSSLANTNGPSDSNGGRILLKPSDGIVPSVRSPNILDNATHQLTSSIAVGANSSTLETQFL